MQSRLLDKVGSGQNLLAYAQTDAGRQWLESLTVERGASPAPYGKILGGSRGRYRPVLLRQLDALVARTRFEPQSSDVFTVLGTLEIIGNTSAKLGTVLAA